MSWWRLAFVIAATVALVGFSNLAAARVIPCPVRAALAASVLRLVLVLGLCLALALRESPDRWALVFAASAAYFAAVVGNAMRLGRVRADSNRGELDG